MPEIPAEKTRVSHSSKAAPNLSPFWCQICTTELCLHNPPFHSTHQYSCLTTAPVWAALDHSLLHSNPFATWDWGKVLRREHFPQYLLVELPTLTWGEAECQAQNKRGNIGCFQNSRDTTTPGIPTWKEQGEPSTEPAVLHKTNPWLPEAPVGWHKQQHTAFTTKISQGFLQDTPFHKAAALRDSAAQRSLFGKGN